MNPTWSDDEYGIELYHADCLDVLPELDNVDAVVTDPPYGTTACKWDTVIPFDKMWECINGVIKENGAIVMTASQPFTTKLISSNYDMFRHCWIWDKKATTGFVNANNKPLSRTEDVVVFSKKRSNYYPIKAIRGKKRKKGGYNKTIYDGDMVYGKLKSIKTYSNEYYPTNIIEISNANHNNRSHPTQKPVALMEYLIKTYTQENETVLDFTMGSGTTGVAAVNLGRKFIGIEMEKEYFDISFERIKQAIIDKQGGELFATHQPEEQQELF